MKLQDNFSESLRILKKFFDGDPDSGTGIRDLSDLMVKFRSGIWHKHPGSATLAE
jgi:hypothetical protein